MGPEVHETAACASLAASLQNLPPEIPITGQTGPKKSLDSNPGVYTNPDQPLIQVDDTSFVFSERFS